MGGTIRSRFVPSLEKYFFYLRSLIFQEKEKICGTVSR
jgi:hypothetical protein